MNSILEKGVGRILSRIMNSFYNTTLKELMRRGILLFNKGLVAGDEKASNIFYHVMFDLLGGESRSLTTCWNVATFICT